jgi:hypothetical protein
VLALAEEEHREQLQQRAEHSRWNDEAARDEQVRASKMMVQTT